MTIVDSDVLLALTTIDAPEGIQDWAKQFTTRPHTTALAIAEIYAAIETVRMSPTETFRQHAMEELLSGVFYRRVLPFDVECAQGLADLSAQRRPDGKPYPLAVLMTAAIARRYNMPLATSRPADFEGLDIDINTVDLTSNR